MQIKKKILGSKITILLVALLGYLLLWTIFLTSRKKYIYDQKAQEYMDGNKNAIFAMWHGRLLMNIFIKPPKLPINSLISPHKDGLYIARLQKLFGVKIIAGSTNRNATSGLRNLLKVAKNGENISITPDGPRGPAHKCADGVLHVAMRSGLPIIPTIFSAKNNRKLGSWDKFMIAYPFNKLIFMVGAPIYLNKGEDIEKARQKVNIEINNIMLQADFEAENS